MMKSILIIEAKMSTLSDKVKTWMNMIGQRRLEDYKISKDIMRISGKIDELSFLNSLLRECDMVHYKVEDGIIMVYLDRNLELKKFRELNRRLLDRGYIYDHKTYR